MPDSELEPIFNVRPRAKVTPGPLGSDIAGVRALTYNIAIATGRNALIQAILRRLITPAGGLFYSLAYGYDLLNAIGATATESQVEQGVTEQILAEEEVDDARVSATILGETLSVTARIVDGDGPFDLTLTVDQLTVEALLDGNTIFQETR